MRDKKSFFGELTKLIVHCYYSFVDKLIDHFFALVVVGVAFVAN